MFRKRNRAAFENFLLAKYEMLAGRDRVESLPSYLVLDPSDICQLRCPTCPTGRETENRRRRRSPLPVYRAERRKLTLELCKQVFDELGDVLFHVMFFNFGEPLLNPHLAGFVRLASEHDIATEIHSNLSLPLDDECIDALLSSGLDRLAASVDGFTQETYEVHRVGGDVDLVKRNLERFARAKERLGSRTQIFYKFLVFKHNEHEIEAARRYSEDIGVTFVASNAIIRDPEWLPAYRAGEAPHLSAEDVDAVFKQWADRGEADYFFEEERQPLWGLVPTPAEAKAPDACAWHYDSAVITGGGKVAPCCATPKDRDDFGAITAGGSGFADVWNNSKYAASRRAFAGRARADDARTVCTHCYFPRFVQRLNAASDASVAARFAEVFGATLPDLARGFDLLVEADPRAFIAHYEARLAGGQGR